jgi:hypothetical protein
VHTKFVEVTQGIKGGFNHGKMMVALFELREWMTHSEMDVKVEGKERSLLERCGWTPYHAMVFDLQTGEGALFLPGGSPSADLTKHRVWVCPLFEPFLEWLYEHVGAFPRDLRSDSVGRLVSPAWFEGLPSLVELPDAPASMQGYRRPGPEEEVA